MRDLEENNSKLDSLLELAQERKLTYEEKITLRDELRGNISKFRANETLNSGVVLCPVHEEKTPSCIVDWDTKKFRCVGCGARGVIKIGVQKGKALDE